MPMTDDDIRALAKAAGIREVAFPDVLRQFPNDGVESFRDWHASVKADKPHWVEEKPAEAGEELYSIKAQTAYVTKNGIEAATKHLASHGLKLGHITERPKEKGGDDGVNASTNPWSKSFKGDAAAREARRQAIIRQSTKLAQKLAAHENLRIDGGPLLNRR
jgi:hypothetical protein